jgi:hypothetical protein
MNRKKSEKTAISQQPLLALLMREVTHHLRQLSDLRNQASEIKAELEKIAQEWERLKTGPRRGASDESSSKTEPV